ncbi:hypothetical protein D018_2327B, partial [Vibrio parahaemolyticus VP2007-007]
TCSKVGSRVLKPCRIAQ